jgi:hypothetical protein
MGGHAGQVDEVPREGYGDGCHPAGLNHQQQYPAIKKRECRVIGLAKIRILSADCGKSGREFGPYECPAQADEPAEEPRSYDERGRVHLTGNDIRVDENAGADDSAHHRHGGVEQAKLAGQARPDVARGGGVVLGHVAMSTTRTSSELSLGRERLCFSAQLARIIGSKCQALSSVFPCTSFP